MADWDDIFTPPIPLHERCDTYAASLKQRITDLTVALQAIRAEVEPVRTRRVRRNGSIKAIIDAVLEVGDE